MKINDLLKKEFPTIDEMEVRTELYKIFLRVLNWKDFKYPDQMYAMAYILVNLFGEKNPLFKELFKEVVANNNVLVIKCSRPFCDVEELLEQLDVKYRKENIALIEKEKVNFGAFTLSLPLITNKEIRTYCERFLEISNEVIKGKDPQAIKDIVCEKK